MKRLAFAFAVLAIGFAVSPARADYALVALRTAGAGSGGTAPAPRGAPAGPRLRSGCLIGLRPRLC